MKGKFYRRVELLISLPKSFYVSWRLTSFKQAFKLPVICRYDTKILSTQGILTGGGNFHMGFRRTGIYGSQKAILNVSGMIELHGNLRLGTGSKLEVGKKGVLLIKGNVYNSDGLTICCHDKIEIGTNVEISWDTLIMDKDFHYIQNIESGTTKSDTKQIIIGNGAWICTGSKILKGSHLPDGCILGAGAVLNKNFEESNCLLIGNPADVVKRGVAMTNEEVLSK